MKGRTIFPFLQIRGHITSEADTAGEHISLCSCNISTVHLLYDHNSLPADPNDFAPVNVTVATSGNRNIQLSSVDDKIGIQNNERFTLKYIHFLGPKFVDLVELMGEFIRHTATVVIIDNGSKYISRTSPFNLFYTIENFYTY